MEKVLLEKHQEMIAEESKRNVLVEKWAPVLNKMPEVHKRKLNLMAVMLDNQHKSMENRRSSSLLTEETTTTNNIADFTRFALPLIRKSYPRLIADNLVGVQPMSTPASLIFYIRYRYGLSKGQTIAGTQIMRQNTGQAFARQNGWALDPYYSSQMVRKEALTIDPAGLVVSGTLLHKPILAGTVVMSVYPDETSACEEAEPCLQVFFDSDGHVSTVLNSSATACPTLTVDAGPTSSSFDHSTGAVTVTLTGSGIPSAMVAKVDYEYDLENNPFQPEITLSIDSDSVSAGTRKLKTSWSIEAAQDLKSVHNIDAEATLTDLMADEMVAEIDREIINDLIIAASIRATHNFATAAGASVNFTDRNIALLYKVLEMANIIHRTTLRGPANWMVTSADIASKFEQLNDFRSSDALADEGVDIGIVKAGTIQGKLRVYKDPLFPNCKVLLGFKGSSVLDAGYFYAPYIPLLSTPTVMDPNTFTPNKGILTRYGKKLIEDGGLFYGVMNVTNL
ncbi:MAG: hypothetical protein Q8K86_08820 [Candidatus Nanopelagicaceae bacterium]|nr:hypothetical protein [Candidatus Nanopelagicaceae bacterium]